MDSPARRAFAALPLRPGARVGVAFSGGPDSAAALRLAAERGAAEGFETVAIHVDHGLRPESASEAARAAAIAARLGVPCVVRREDVRAWRARRGGSLEGAARERRYAALAEEAARLALDATVVAHHRDDQVETVLLALLRGGGFDALAGMSPARPLTAACVLLRPFLDVARDDLRRDSPAGDAVDDPSNFDERFRRNAVRRALLPALRGVEPDVDALVLALAADARAVVDAADRAWARVIDQARVEPGLFEAPRAALDAAGRIARRRGWVRVFKESDAFGGPASEGLLTTLEHAFERPPHHDDLRPGVRLLSGAETTALYVAASPFDSVATFPADAARLELPAGGPRRVVVRRLPHGEPPPADADAPRRFRLHLRDGATLEVREPRPGDRFLLERGDGRGRALDVLTDAKVSRVWRRRVPLVFVDGALRWIAGVRRVGVAGEGAANAELILEGPAPWIDAPRA
ncbi:MAG TPA: tRNA lysidine(34) synthetase TilS [Planctomycetota bacterium]|nr:tRNA lysidine(34) synthetase TilS [Planctomycetota bacterium]